MPEVLATEIRWKNKIKMIKVGKRDFKLSLCLHDMVPYFKDSNDCISKVLPLLTPII